ncbi:MAG: hypothetical protein RBU45_24935 [Myxococcota bacterium]|jgi:hypothetical protein|nr:hypothetical protein [Myxococcota bacterium]
MKLTPLAKVFIALVVLAVIGYVVYARFGDQIREWAGSPKPPVAGEGVAGSGQPGATAGVGKADFTGVAEAPADPGRGGVTGVTVANVAEGKLGRPLVVGINTWAGHAPGIVANLGLEPNPAGLYKTRYGLDVKFVLLDDPAAKLARPRVDRAALPAAAHPHDPRSGGRREGGGLTRSSQEQPQLPLPALAARRRLPLTTPGGC